MFWRSRKQEEQAAAIATLTVRMEVLERAVLILIDHVEALEQRRPPIARVLDEFRPDGRPQ
jgi:hypothetical protein